MKKTGGSDALVVIVAFMLATCGCGLESPTTASDTAHPKEAFVYEMTQCHGEYHRLGPIEVVFEDEKYFPFKDDPDPARRKQYAWGWTVVGERLVRYYRPYVHSAVLLDLEATAAHVVSHALGIADEDSAGLTARDAMAHTVCAPDAYYEQS